jgi:DNA polymerase III epsilon subunit-like protein
MSDAPTRPRWASRRIHRTKRDLAALDFETTGLDADDTVVSFGVVPVFDGGSRSPAASTGRVSVASDLSARSIVVHGLLPSDLADSPPMDVRTTPVAEHGNHVVVRTHPRSASRELQESAR